MQYCLESALYGARPPPGPPLGDLELLPERGMAENTQAKAPEAARTTRAEILLYKANNHLGLRRKLPCVRYQRPAGESQTQELKNNVYRIVQTVSAKL